MLSISCNDRDNQHDFLLYSSEQKNLKMYKKLNKCISKIK